MNIVLGVDPGMSGAVAWVDSSGELLGVVDMPVTDMVNAAALSSVIRDSEATVAVVEKVASMPGQGVASTFKFGVGYGVVLGVLGALHMPVHHVTPSQWKRALGLTRDKGTSRRRAVDLWPDHAPSFARVKDDGRAEAALIAHWYITKEPHA